MSVGRERLDRTRLAILEYLQHTRHGDASPPAPTEPEGQLPPGARASWWSSLREAAYRHWERHPARLVTRLLAPALSYWGRRHPLAFVAIAVGAGAVVVLTRPWKLISVTGLAVAVLKSPQLASLALSALASFRTHAQEPDRPHP